ncbi:MAG: alpha/beta hydrolase, partial [Syntrophales bacterium LBB04]|nr:alpha/beta hydrolase [Syntrophales bacterium LBB04]
GQKAKMGSSEMAYNVAGAGTPLFLVGGFTMVKEMWSPLADMFAQQYLVITFDNRGVGASTVPDTDFTAADMAADVVGLMDHLGHDKAHVFGVSLGGLIAQMLVLDHADRVRKAVLGCTTHGGRHAIAQDPEVLALLASAADPTIPAEEAIRKRMSVNLAERFQREQPQKVEEFVQMALRHQPTPKGAQGQMKALSFFNVKRRLGEIRCPVLVITGDEDKMVPPGNSQLLAEGISGAELYIMQDAGHSFFRERPDEVHRVVTAFLNKP